MCVCAKLKGETKMGRSPTCSKDGLNKGAWTAAEDKILLDYVKVHGEGKWSRLSRETGLKRCGKSCRLRWMNYLRPDIKRGNISPDEEELIIRLHKLLGNRWSLIAGRLPGRTDNEIKNYWNTNLAKKPEALRTVPFCHTEKKPIIKPGTTSEPELDQQRTEECKVGGVTDPKPPTAQQIASNLDLGPSTNGNDLLKQILSDSDMSDGSLSLNSAEEGSADFMIDFNVDDICRFLDTDFSKLNANQNGEVNDECENKYPSYINQHFVLPDVEKDLNASDRLREDSISGFQSLASFFEPDDGKWAVTAAAADDNVNFVCSGKSD